MSYSIPSSRSRQALSPNNHGVFERIDHRTRDGEQAAEEPQNPESNPRSCVLRPPTRKLDSAAASLAGSSGTSRSPTRRCAVRGGGVSGGVGRAQLLVGRPDASDLPGGVTASNPAFSRAGRLWQRCSARAAVAWIPERPKWHRDVLRGLITKYHVVGNLVTDARLAAIAIEHGVPVASADTDFARFTEIRWSTARVVGRRRRRPRRRRLMRRCPSTNGRS